MILKIDKNVQLIGSNNTEDFPLIDPLPSFGIGRDHAKNLTKRYHALIGAWNCSNITIEGEGLINGNG